MLLGRHTEFVVEGVMPDLLHVVPVGHDPVFDWVFESEDATFALGFVSDVGVLLSHSDHDTLMARTAYDAREHGAWSVISSETSFAHAGAVVDNQSCNIFVSHCDISREMRERVSVEI